MDLSEMKLDPVSARKWEAYRQPPEREPEQRDRGRAAFLAQVDAIPQSRRDAARAASSGKPASKVSWFRIKSFSPAWMTVVLLLALVLVLAAGGAAAYAAQDSLPGETLYGLKTASENLLITLAASDETRLDLDLELADRRVGEIRALIQSGRAAPAGVVDKLQIKLHSMLLLAAGMDDPAMNQALLQIRQRTLLQQQMMLEAPDQANPVVLRVMSMLQQQLQVAEMGLADPAGYRQQMLRWQPAPPTQAPLRSSDSPTGASTPGQPQPAGKPTAGSLQVTPAGLGPGKTPGAQATAQPGGYATGGPNSTQAPDGSSTGPGPNNPLQPNDPGPSDPGGDGKGEPGGTGGGGGKHP